MLQLRFATTNRIRVFLSVQNQHQGDAKAAGLCVQPLRRRHRLFPSPFGKRLTKKECMLLVGPELGGELASVSISIFLSFCLSGATEKFVMPYKKKKKKSIFRLFCLALLHIKETISGKRKTGCHGRKVSRLYLQNHLKTMIFYIAYYTFFLLQCERCAER